MIKFRLSERQMHVIRTFTPQQDCMALSVSKGPGQEKIFEIFASGNQCEDSESEDCDCDEDDEILETCPAPYSAQHEIKESEDCDCDEDDEISKILLRFHRRYCPALYDWFEMDPTQPYFVAQTVYEYFGTDASCLKIFFCNDGASADGMASIICCACDRDQFKDAVERFLEMIMCILDADEVSPEQPSPVGLQVAEESSGQ